MAKSRGFLGINKVAKLYDVHPKTVGAMVLRGQIPEPIEMQLTDDDTGRKSLRWVAEEVYESLERLKFTAPRKKYQRKRMETKESEGKSAKPPKNAN